MVSPFQFIIYHNTKISTVTDFFNFLVITCQPIDYFLTNAKNAMPLYEVIHRGSYLSDYSPVCIECSGVCLSISSALCNEANDASSVETNVKLEGCIELNEHNTLFTRSGPLYNRSFPGPIRVLKANGILIASEFSAGLTR